jgi:plasmid maintenance system antidote protein VapI
MKSCRASAASRPTADLRLTRYFGLSEGFFLGLQADYDLMERRREIGGDLATITPRAA